jgi:hypothetical protein
MDGERRLWMLNSLTKAMKCVNDACRGWYLAESGRMKNDERRSQTQLVLPDATVRHSVRTPTCPQAHTRSL